MITYRNYGGKIGRLKVIIRVKKQKKGDYLNP